jgi:16S rRNA (cytosine967-C5)-methyltransferase
LKTPVRRAPDKLRVAKPQPQVENATVRTKTQGPAGKRNSPAGRPVSAGPTLDAAEAWAKVSPVRRAAYDVLALVEQGKGHSDELLHSARLDDLSEADRNLATALVMGVLRWQIALDARIAKLLQRPDQRLAEPVSLALRLGAFQLLKMDRIPAHAALSESVELCRAAGHPHATGMVNAILRKLASAQPPSERVFESSAAFAERLGHPRWLVERWVAHFGRETALRICAADQVEPERGRIFAHQDELPLIDDGSRLVAELAAAALPVVSGRAPRVWDCCAAPGGKTLVLAARLEDADLLATDVSARRLAAMQSRFACAHNADAIRTGVADATRLPPVEGDFDLILLDAPCSGSGTLGRNPEIRLRLSVEEVTRQAQRQKELLAAALARLAPGGRLVYSTCSLEPEENEAVVATIPQQFRLLPAEAFAAKIPDLLVPLDSIHAENALRTVPGVDPCDGFFAQIIERPA